MANVSRRKVSARCDSAESERRRTRKYERLIARAKDVPPAATHRGASLRRDLAARCRSRRRKRASSFRSWSDPPRKIKAVAREHKLDIGKYEIVDAPHSDAAAAKARRTDP